MHCAVDFRRFASLVTDVKNPRGQAEKNKPLRAAAVPKKMPENASPERLEGILGQVLAFTYEAVGPLLSRWSAQRFS